MQPGAYNFPLATSREPVARSWRCAQGTFDADKAFEINPLGVLSLLYKSEHVRDATARNAGSTRCFFRHPVALRRACLDTCRREVGPVETLALVRLSYGNDLRDADVALFAKCVVGGEVDGIPKYRMVRRQGCLCIHKG